MPRGIYKRRKHKAATRRRHIAESIQEIVKRSPPLGTGELRDRQDPNGFVTMADGTVTQPTITNSLDEFQPIYQRMSLVIERLDALNSRIRGVTTKSPNPGPRTNVVPEGGLIARIHHDREDLSKAVEWLERYAMSIDDAI